MNAPKLIHVGLNCTKFLSKIQPLLGEVGGLAASCDPRFLFVGVFTAARFFATFTPGCCGAAVACIASLALTFLSSTLLVFAEQVNATAVWVSIIMQAVIETVHFMILK